MAAPMELFCWSGGWGLPSVDLDSLAVLTYARFTGAPLKVHKITNPWQSPSGTLPALRTSHGEVISVPHKIITHLRKEKYNADYDLSARQGADALAFMSLLEEKLLPVLIHTFWVDTKNYVEVTRKWYAEAMPFPLNFFLPGRMQRQFMERLQLLGGKHRPENEEELEKEVPLGQGAAVGEEPQRRWSGMGLPRPGGGSVPAAASLPCVLPTAVPRGSGMPDPALPAPGLSEVLLRRCPRLPGRLCLQLLGPAAAGQAAQREAAGPPAGAAEPLCLLHTHPQPLLPLGWS
nr:metaxin-1 isoform X1 [Neomonachus schauinslandi]